MSANRVPVTILTGFLGSGKTTMVNHILTSPDHKQRVAVIENEFGEVGIDDALVYNSQEEIFEMNNGCICCTVRGDLIKILHRLAPKKFDTVLVETTGMADPAPVAQTFFVDDFVKEHYRLDALLTVVDAKHVVQHLDEEKPDGVENEAIEQIAFADKVILNKTDLVNEQEKANVIQRIKAINSFANIIEAVMSRVPVAELLNINAFDINRILENEPDFLKDSDAEHQHDPRVSSVGMQVEGELSEDKVNKWLSKLLSEKGTDIFRSKGVLAIKGEDHKFVFQGVHMLMGFGSTAEGRGKPWGKDEKRINRIVFIGRNLDRKQLNEEFQKCVA
ncbi:CobW/HypB/UreG, nucleotide-binding domain-containing protein [Dunaliella salina]|uniref:CobW/HypB/UreG, nucleotide-binding domain-containing protein n=1 Tax=Dunaliella salina TaxID=3046 RepID=A0ABQ7GTA8_DUNSA|nr:CobW/HypB/UreG, nucleotide-binding domain-containing protein [Dunaliella salina]|eukprot:KAF5837802.1 CobW/HypB/UreG, nucleotide-binding domain-containing protein [Dunaliella salina]